MSELPCLTGLTFGVCAVALSLVSAFIAWRAHQRAKRMVETLSKFMEVPPP